MRQGAEAAAPWQAVEAGSRGRGAMAGRAAKAGRKGKERWEEEEGDADLWDPLVITVNLMVRNNRIDFPTTLAQTDRPRMS